MSAHKSGIFLAKNGKIFGPFSDAEIESYQTSGELERFHWIWDEGRETWKPLHAAPTTSPLTSQTVPRRGSTAAALDQLSVICHDFHQAALGKVAKVTETGCELLVPTQHEGNASPLFKQASKAFLNLLNPNTGTTTQVPVVLANCSRNGNEWIYQVRWNGCPTI